MCETLFTEHFWSINVNINDFVLHRFPRLIINFSKFKSSKFKLIQNDTMTLHSRAVILAGYKEKIEEYVVSSKDTNNLNNKE